MNRVNEAKAASKGRSNGSNTDIGIRRDVIHAQTHILSIFFVRFAFNVNLFILLFSLAHPTADTDLPLPLIGTTPCQSVTSVLCSLWPYLVRFRLRFGFSLIPAPTALSFALYIKFLYPTSSFMLSTENSQRISIAGAKICDIGFNSSILCPGRSQPSKSSSSL